MRTIITERMEQLKQEFIVFFLGEDVRIEHAEEVLTGKIRETVCGLMGACYEEKDRELLENKGYRKAAGLRVERRNDKRSVLTEFGQVDYKRTYYEGEEGYCYPIDEIAGVESRQRISMGINRELVEKAIDYSYEKSSRIVTNGDVSKQTVMNKIRASRVPERERKGLRLHARALHIDADEDHVNLQSGKNTSVPVICSYEGIERKRGRGSCINKSQYSEYGEKAEELWRKVYEDIEKTYDLTGTRIYIHGDGAKWIQGGKGFFPGSNFVLDPYHKNKAIKELFSGPLAKKRKESERLLREAMETGNAEKCEAIIESLISSPNVKKRNEEAGEYLLRNIEGILVYYTDEEARRGGATEPHVSHILSSRLSSRPMGWSEETLKAFVPILAARRFEICRKPKEKSKEKPAETKEIKKSKPKHAIGLPDPDKSVILNAAVERESVLYKILHFPKGHWIGAPDFFPTIS